MLPSIRVEISNYCNLRCPHCVREDAKKTYKLNSKHVSLDTLKTWLNPGFLYFKTSKKIFFSGAIAEPTLNPECLEIVKYFSKYSKITLDSNGSTNNEIWWEKLGSTKISCIFSPDSLIPNNNLYRINSNTEKVIQNMKSFIRGGGFAEWKYIPFKHNESEYDEHKKIATEIGARFIVVQPKQFDENNNTGDMKSSKYFKKSNEHSTSYVLNSSPNEYCKLFGVKDKLIEISPDGIIYPCCFLARALFLTYGNFFTSGNPTPIIQEYMMSDLRYKTFVSDILPLIEMQGGIKTLSLHYNTISNILKTDFYKFALINSWKTKNDCCNKHCGSRAYVYGSEL
jgi:MoaA/NifB/PqqE/SkfB family radical SAM enzyme